MKKINFISILFFFCLFLSKLRATLTIGVSSFIFTRGKLIIIDVINNLLQVQQATGTTSQRFIVENSQITDFYFIKHVQSGNYFEVKGGSKRDGQKIILNSKKMSNNDQQLFSLISSQNGYYKIKNKLTLKYLDIYNKLFIAGNYIQQWTDNNSTNQEFYFQQTPQMELLTLYKIFTINTQFLLNIETGTTANSNRVILHPPANTQNEKFSFEMSAEPGYYFIKINYSGKYFTVQGASLIDGAQIEQYEKDPINNNHQIFKIDFDGTYYFFIAKNSGKAFAVWNDQFVQLNPIKQYTINYANRDLKFSLVKV